MSYQKLCDGIDFIYEKTNKFKTTLLSVHFYTKVTEENTAVNAILPYLLIGGAPDYPDFTTINAKLNMLYGAELTCKIRLLGDIRQTSIQLAFINDSYADNPILKDATEFLHHVIFGRFERDYGFLEKEILREKRLLCQQIESLKNNKRAYARNKAKELLFAGEPAGIFCYGTTKAVEALAAEDILSAYKKLLKTARIRITAVGDTLPEGFAESMSAAFNMTERDYSPLPEDIATPYGELQTTIERMPVIQGKTVLGFCSEQGGDDLETLPMYVMADLLGGGPYSRLFLNVREKQSLCYYCAANALRSKGVLFVDSGIEPNNAERVSEAVQKEVKALAEGEFTEEELQTCKRALCDALQALKDDQVACEGFLSSRFRQLYEPDLDGFTEAVSKITAEQVRSSAATLKLRTVYTLLPEEVQEK